MMKTHNSRLLTSEIKVLVLMIITLIISGCASKPGPIPPMQRSDDYRFSAAVLPFKPVDIALKKEKNQYQQKTSNIIILVDNKSDKKELINKTLENLMATMPNNLPYQQEVIYRDDLQNLLNRAISSQDFLSAGLEYYVKQLKRSKTHSTIITLTDWNKITSATVAQSEQLFFKLGNNICLHMIGVNNIHKNKRLIRAENCGSSSNTKSLASANKMADFVERIFFTTPKDSDKDGIYNDRDQCPNTPAETPINWNGCPRNSKTSNPRYLIK